MSHLHSDILAIHPGALGDCILLGRVLEKLDGKVTFVGHGCVAKLLAGMGIVSKKIDYDLLPMQELFTDAPIEQTQLSKRLGTCEKLISVYGEGNPAVEERLVRATGAKEATFPPIRPPAEYPGHLTELWMEKLGSPLRCKDLCTSVWRVPDEWRDNAKRRLHEAGIVDQNYVVLHPGAGGAEKRWPIERFADVARAMQTQRNALPVFVLGPVEREMFAKKEIKFIKRWPVVFAPAMEEFTGLLSGAIGMVGNDSGPAHLSASIGIRTGCIFSTTSATHFRPLGKNVILFYANDMPELVVKEIVRRF